MDLAFWTPEFWVGHEREITTLALYSVGLAAYAVVVAFFYRYISLRDLRARPAKAKGFGGKLLAALRFLFAFPLLSFSYFSVLAASLFILAKNLTPEQILLTSMSLVAGVRVATYVNEKAAGDLAKLVPLGLLGVLIVDPGYLSLATTTDRFLSLPALLPTLVRYFLAIVALEFALRIVKLVLPGGKEKDATPVPVKAAESREALARAPGARR